jgi:epoxyqueuosine reductase
MSMPLRRFTLCAFARFNEFANLLEGCILPAMTLSERKTLAGQVKQKARELLFDLVGVTAAGPAQSHTRYIAWLSRGHHGAMNYLARPDAVARRADVRELLPSARSVVVVGMNYYQPPPPAPPPSLTGEGRVARYAWGDDYHEVIAEKLERLVAFVKAEAGHPVAHKICVDTSAVLEREWAVRAGLGWIGKNTLLINPRAGSWFLLGALLLDLEMDYDAPFSAEMCGTCTRCIQACPTHCILPDRDLDASRCISYLTIELRGDIPSDLREYVGDWVLGCDVCQEVCPWNRFARPTSEAAFAPRNARLDLRTLVAMNDETFRARFAHSAIRRARREGLLRNAAIVAENRHLDKGSQ